MWTKIVTVLKKVLMIGAQALPVVAATYSPALGTLVETVLHAVLVTEATPGAGKGVDKKAFALNAVQVAMPGIQYAFTAAGKPIVNAELFAAGVEKIQDGIVDILNATGETTK